MDRPTALHFTRDPGPLALSGFRGQGQALLRMEMDRAGLQGSWVVADLSLGAWRGHQVAQEFCAQLDVDLPPPESPTTEEMSGEGGIEVAYADIIGEFIDAEARGDQATISSLQFASLIKEKVLKDPPRVFLVMAPRYGMPWETENIIFIRLLSQALKGTESGLVLIATGDSDPDVPPDWDICWHGEVSAAPVSGGEDIVGLIPGLITPEMADTLRAAGLVEQTDLIPLAGGHWLVPADVRRHPEDVSRLEFDRLGALARPYGWLDAYAQFYGNKMYVEPWFLYAEGRRCFAEGGTGVTLRLIDRAIENVHMGVEWGILQSYAQGLRVASHHFAEAAGIIDPPASLPAVLRSFLVQCKGWGLVMLGELARAEECFRQASELTDETSRDHREYLYLLNITALCSLKKGEVEHAFALEREIEKRFEKLAVPDRRLQYVNAINIARLHWRRGNLQKSEQYYGNAFATTMGARTESDAIYVNVIMAKLHTTAGKHQEAFTCWMRAGLHWAASDAPEAVRERIVRHILGTKLNPDTSTLEAISASLTDSILSAAAASGNAEVVRSVQGLALDGRDAPVFVRTDLLQGTQPHAVIDGALLSSGLSVFATQHPMDPHIMGENTLRLRVLLYTLLEALAPPGFLSGARTIIVDDSVGREIPATPGELLATCVRLDIQDVAMEGERLALTAEIRARIEQGLLVHVGCAVERVVIYDGSMVVIFKRYLPPIVLSIEESHLLALVDSEPTIAEIVHRCEETGSRQDVLQILRGLEQKRVLNINSPQHDALAAELRVMM